jgi:hypothetical protein
MQHWIDDLVVSSGDIGDMKVGLSPSSMYAFASLGVTKGPLGPMVFQSPLLLV